MKLANWNVEWMNKWFTADVDAPAFKPAADAARSGITDLPALAGRVGAVVEAIDPDVLCIQEGPSRVEEMRLFVDGVLDGRYEVYGPSGTGAQKLYALVKKGGAVATVGFPPPAERIDLGEVWEVDVDGDMRLGPYEFTRDPLVLDLTGPSGKVVRLINLHTKSKYVHRGRELWAEDRQAFVAFALKARRRISAEVMRVREYVDAMLERDPEALIAVAGDLNDGPGTDYFERRYLTHNLVAMLAGSPFHPRRMLRHAFIDAVDKELNYTAVFDDFVDGIDDRKLLLDHILLSPALHWLGGDTPAAGVIEHAAFEAQIDEDATGRQRLPSDHRPQSVVLPV